MSIVAPIRVLIADMPPLFAYMLAGAIMAQPDMQLIGQVEGALPLLLAARQGGDVVILGAAQLQPAPGVISHLFSEVPKIKVLLVSPHENSAIGYWLRVSHYPITVVSASTLVGDVRQLYALTPMV